MFMREYNGYDRIDNFMKYSQSVVFNRQLDYEGKDLLINGKEIRGIVRNDQNPMSETKEDRSLIVDLDVSINRGNYVEYKRSTYMIVTKVDEESFYQKCKIRECNQTLNCKGQSKPIPCVVDNTVHGTGVKDNGYFVEYDSRLKILIQKNKETDRYYIGMRFIFNNRFCYKITKVDNITSNEIYMIELVLSSLSPLDDLENNIAYNEKLEDNKPPENYKIIGADKIKVGQISTYKLEPQRLDIVYEIDDKNYATIVEQQNGECKVKALKQNGIVTLSAKCDSEILDEFNIITM